ncbi:hypothetical protein WICMUC_000289 [Wickerhamomyces mucosus]|uniref:Secreted protein n=1 Tax=Wickerhamomyces mucosus TaxID=1378264 RepID=A0A9P8PY65_9ASCO|nr:hypothetical protein WICMUC_000289 [Wickerhamomyces mucosus]
MLYPKFLLISLLSGLSITQSLDYGITNDDNNIVNDPSTKTIGYVTSTTTLGLDLPTPTETFNYNDDDNYGYDYDENHGDDGYKEELDGVDDEDKVDEHEKEEEDDDDEHDEGDETTVIATTSTKVSNSTKTKSHTYQFVTTGSDLILKNVSNSSATVATHESENGAVLLQTKFIAGLSLIAGVVLLI